MGVIAAVTILLALALSTFLLDVENMRASWTAHRLAQRYEADRELGDNQKPSG